MVWYTVTNLDFKKIQTMLIFEDFSKNNYSFEVWSGMIYHINFNTRTIVVSNIDTTHMKVDFLVQRLNDPLLDTIQDELKDTYKIKSLLVEVELDFDEDFKKIDDESVEMKLVIDGQSYNDWFIEKRNVGWGARVGKNYGL